jgi:ParB/RepB/Spo0J family partition protein
VVPVRDVLITGWNPRKRFDEEALRELAASIEAIGLLEPVLVRPKGSKYELVVGERRLRAFRLLKRELIPAVVREMSDEEVLDAMLAENVCREDLDPIEEANALKRALEVSKLSQAEFGRRVGRFGKSQEWVAQRIKLTEAPPELQEEIIRRRIKPSAVVEILQQKGNNNYQSTLDAVLKLAKVQGEVTVREVREIIRTYRPAPKPVVDVERLRQGTEFMEPDVIEIPEEKPQVEEPEDLPEERKASPEVEKEPASEDEPDPDDPGIDRSERRVITREQFEETSTTWDDLKEPAPRPWRDVKARYGQMPSSNTAKRELLEWAFPWLKEGGA